MASRENARRFHFLREIATGGFGTVWLCKVLHADGFTRIAAVKLLKAQWTDSEEIVRRIRDEARLLGLLRHRAIITVYDLTSIDGRAAVVMEYIEGVDLRTVIKALRNREETVPIRTVLDIAATVAGALDAAYNQPPMPGDKPLRVIHRDIKPSNIMVDIHGDVKVLDFGVARSDIENRESHTEELQFGSVDYMAPERLFFEPETPAGDIYALGATIFELLALEKLGKARGRPAQHAAELEDRLSFLRATMRVRSTVATELIDLLRSCLGYEHEARPTAAELQQRCRALARLVEDEELRPWAERVIPPLHEAAAAAPRKPSPMSDSVRLEDSVSFSATPASLADGLDEDLGRRLRKGALRELEDSTGRVRPDPEAGPEGPPATVERPPAARPLFAGRKEDALLLPEPEPPPASAAKPAAAPTPTSAAKPAAAPTPTSAAKPAAGREEGAGGSGASNAAVAGDRRPTRARAASPPGGSATPVDPGAVDLPRVGAYPRSRPPSASPRPVGAFTTGEHEAAAAPPPGGHGDPVDDWTDLPTKVDGLTSPARTPGPVAADPAPRAAGAVDIADPGMVDLAAPARPRSLGPGPVDEAPLRLSPATGAPPRPNGTAAGVGSSVDDSGIYEAEPTLSEPTLSEPTPSEAPQHEPTELDLGAPLDAAPSTPAAGADPPPGRRRAMLLGGLAGGCLLVVVSGVLISVFGWWFTNRNTGDPAAEALLEALGSEPADDAPPAPPAGGGDAAAHAGGMSFESLDPETRKLSVRCAEGESRGVTTAHLDLPHADRCTVTAILADRSRLVAVLDDVGPGAYACFPDGRSTCEPR